MKRLVNGLLLEEFQSEIRGAAGAKTGTGIVAKRQFGECLVTERFRSRTGLGGGADLLFVSGGNVNDGREIYLPTFGRRAHSGDERGRRWRDQ